MNSDCSEIMVLIRHSHGNIEVPLEYWIANGPGERKYVAPISARCADDNRKLPLSVIPLIYRNNWLSRLLIHFGILQNPWTNA